MYCEHCNSPNGPEEKCCWLRGVEIVKFKRRVLHSYILEPIFDMVVSTISVILDIITLINYTLKKKWALAILTAFPILLPTTVFANVYMTNSKKDKPTRKYTKKKNKTPLFQRPSSERFHMLEERVEAAQKLSLFNLLGCCSGMLHSLFHKDRIVRKRGAKLAGKSFRRSSKYLFGTLVLRFIAWSWYMKALFFGVKAMREPKKYMQMEQPDKHWSRELLIRLDFLQAALENAPQCVIQLYTLLTDFSEDSTLGILTLSFSFVDFVRVVSTVFWNVHKGPIVAPKGSYGTKFWKSLNVLSWVLIYTARCCAVALVIGTAAASKNGIYAVPIVFLILHVILFAKLFSAKQLGQVAEKVMVTTFISIFFLPELDSKDVHVLIQFYYAMILLENTVFTVPFRGLDFPGYCLELKNSTTSVHIKNDERHCLIEPWVIVFLVPLFTITGSVIRLTAYQRMAAIRNSFRPRTLSINRISVEERVAIIYKKRWTTMSVKEMWTGFTRMLGKEDEVPVLETETFQIQVAPLDIHNTFRVSQEFIRKSASALCIHSGVDSNRDEVGTEAHFLGQQCQNHGSNPKTFPRMKCCTNIQTNSTSETNNGRRPSIMSRDFREDPNPTEETNEPNILTTLDVRFLRIETPNGVQVFQMVDI